MKVALDDNRGWTLRGPTIFLAGLPRASYGLNTKPKDHPCDSQPFDECRRASHMVLLSLPGPLSIREILPKTPRLICSPKHNNEIIKQALFHKALYLSLIHI